MSISQLPRYYSQALVQSATVQSLRQAITTPVRQLVRKYIKPSILKLALLWLRWQSAKVQQQTVAQGDALSREREALVEDPPAPNTTRGFTVIDKRKFKRDTPRDDGSEAAPLNSGPIATAPAPALDKLKSFWRCVVGGAVRWASPTTIPAMRGNQLASALVSSCVLQALVADKPDPTISLSLVIDVASNNTPHDWRIASNQWIRHHADGLELETVVSQQLATEELPARRCALLRLVPEVASTMSDEHARSTFGHLLQAVERTVSPYDPSGETLLARRALVSLLRQRHELEPMALAALSARGPTDEFPLLAQLLAVALRARGPATPLVIADAATSGKFTSTEITEMARLANSSLRTLPQPALARGGIAAMPTGPVWRRVFCWIVVLAVCFGSSALLQAQLPRISPLEVPVAAAIATLALLATVQVFAANLSGNRLPGIIARHTSQSWQLDVAYGASLTMIGLAIWQPSQPEPGPWTFLRNWLSTVSLAIWACSLILALLTIFGRVDFARAAAGFVSIRKQQARNVGRKVGRYQASAMELNSLIESCSAVESLVRAVPGTWDRPIEAHQRGIFLPHRRGLRRLLASEPMRAGLRLRITSVIGMTVNRHDNLAYALPLEDQSIRPGWISRARRGFKVRSSADIDETSSAALALVKLTSDLVTSGDIGTAHQVAQSVADFVNAHMAHARTARRAALNRWALRESVKGGQTETAKPAIDSVGSNPTLSRQASNPPIHALLRDVLGVATRAAVDTAGPGSNVFEYLIRTLLTPTDENEYAAAIVIASISGKNVDTDRKLEATREILRICGLHTLEHQNSTAWGLLLSEVERMAERVESDSQIREFVTDLTAYACRHNYRLALSGSTTLETILDAYPDREREKDAGADHFWLIGGAAVAVGASSLVLSMAELVRRRGYAPRIVTGSERHATLELFATRAQFSGGFLGDRPLDALAIFGQFVAKHGDWLEAQNTN